MKKFVLFAAMFAVASVNASETALIQEFQAANPTAIVTSPIEVSAAPVVTKTLKESALDKVASASTFVAAKVSVAQAFVASKTPACVTNAVTAIDAQITARPYCAIAIAAVAAYAVAKLTSDSSQEEDEEDYA